MKLTRPIFLWLLFFSSFHLKAADTSPEVELLVESTELRPSTTLEFRFVRPMIPKENVGLAAQSPVFFDPAWPGKFTWLSSQSGVYVPDAAPSLGVTYTVTLRPELQDLQGMAIGKSFLTRLTTPPFSGLAKDIDEKNSITPPLPEVRLVFNQKIDLEKSPAVFQFRNDAGEIIPALPRFANRGDYFTVASQEGDWETRWQAARSPVPEEEENEMNFEERRKILLQDRLIVTPQKALTPGSFWRLEMQPGLKSLANGQPLSQSLKIPLGQVTPFTLTKVSTDNLLNTGRSVTLDFSHSLAPDIDAERGTQFFKIEPPVANLRVEPGYESLTLRGDFALGQEYMVRVGKNVISQSGLPFSGNHERSFAFEPIKPRVYLPAITSHQIRSGLRKFTVRTINLRQLQVTARLVDPANVPAALEAFSKYPRVEWDEKNPHEQFQPVAPETIPGTVIAEKTIDLTNPIDTRHEFDLDWDEIVGPQKSGTVFLTVTGEPVASLASRRPAAQALVVLTDLGVLWKKERQTVRATVFSLSTGRPLPDVQVRLQDRDPSESVTGKTNANGEIDLPIPPDIIWLTAQTNDDFQALPLGDGTLDLPSAGFRVPITYSPWKSADVRPETRAFIFTDRPLYRPGETVRIKGYIRELDGNQLKIKELHQARVILNNARWEKVFESTIESDKRGAFDLAITLPTENVGRHTLSIAGASTAFQVADYQPNAFTITADSTARLAPEKPVELTVAGSYFFGAPVSDATVRWTLQTQESGFSPPRFEEFRFLGDTSTSSKTQTLRGEGKILSKEGWLIRPQVPAAASSPIQGVWTLDVTDLNQQTVSESRTFTRDSADFYLGLAIPPQSVVRAGTEIPLRVVGVRPTGEPLTETVAVETELIRTRFQTVRVQGAGGAISFRTDLTEEPVTRLQGKTLPPILENGRWTVREGATALLRPDRAGRYIVRMTATDSARRKTVTEWSFYVAGPEETVWDYRNPAQIDLIPDKEEYQPGDTARLLVKTPIAGEALLTIEQGDRIVRSEKITLSGNAPVVEVPLTEKDAPNVFVSLILLRGSEASPRKFKMPEYRQGLIQLRVAHPARSLLVKIQPETPETQPGAEVVVDVSINNGLGVPLENAEVTVFAVDDGILALTGYERPQPGELFHRTIPLGVRTGLSLYQLLAEDSTALEFANKGYLIGGGGLEGPGIKLRSNFPGTAAWFTNLRTDAQGRVQVRFPAPDALTRYRLVAVAQAAADFFGSGESSFVIRKPLLLLPSIGQFAHIGDRLLARTVVRNDTGSTGEVTVQLTTDALARKETDDVQKITLKNGESRAVDFPVVFTDTGESHWQWTANLAVEGKVFEDRVASSIQVQSPSVLLRETILTNLAGKTNPVFSRINPQLREGTGSVAVSLSNTRLTSLRESVFYLRDYPYSCGEQTVSRLVPWLVWETLRPVLPDANVSNVAGQAQAGVQRLFALQTPSGGLSWWPSSNRPSLFVSAYAAAAIAQWSQNGNTPPSAGWNKLTGWLSEQLRDLENDKSEADLSDRALTLYALALAGKAEPAYHEILFQRRASLTRETRALLALAIIASNGPDSLIAPLLDPKVIAPDSFSLVGGAGRERALQLLAWSRWKPESDQVAPLVKELLGMQRLGHWHTTQDNAWALLALTEVFAKVEKGAKTVSGQIIAGDEKSDFELTRKNPIQSFVFSYSPENPLPDLLVNNPKKLPLFGEARFKVRPPLAGQPRQDRGFAVSRSYQKINTDGKLIAASELRVGDRIVVSLRVESNRPAHFVAIDDPLPSILEAINPDFAHPDQDRSLSSAPISYRETRKDRVLFFCDRLPAGAFSFSYLARVRSSGETIAPATKVEEMYRPERFGLGEVARLTSRAE